MSMLQASIRRTGPLAAKIERIRAERIAAGLLKDNDPDDKKPVVLISLNGGKQVEERKFEAPLVSAETEATHHGPSMETIFDIVKSYYSLSDAEFYAKFGSMTAKTARLIAALLCKKMTIHSLQSIGRKLGGRDHSTIAKGITRFERKIARDFRLAADLSSIVYRINAVTFGGGEVISEATQLAALQMAIDVAHGHTSLNASQRELFQMQIESIRSRIIAASARRDAIMERVRA